MVLYVNDKKVGEGEIDKTLKSSIGTYENIEIGKDVISPVTDSYKTPFAFTGSLNLVTLELDKIVTTP